MITLKQQNDFSPHDANSLEEGWDATAKYLEGAVLIAFDECHKIYLAMDEIEADFFRLNYSPHTVEGLSPNMMLAIVKDWYEQSCPLRFINAVWHDEVDPNAGFVSLISQTAGYEDEDEEDED